MKKILIAFVLLTAASCTKDDPKYCWNVRGQDGALRYRNLCHLTEKQVREQYPCDCSYEIAQ